jgi:hypothetical protein
MSLTVDLSAPRAGLGRYGRNTHFSLRNLPFGFLTQHIRGAFPPTWSAESSLRVLQRGNLANKKAHAFSTGPLFAGSPS